MQSDTNRRQAWEGSGFGFTNLCTEEINKPYTETNDTGFPHPADNVFLLIKIYHHPNSFLKINLQRIYLLGLF